MKRILDHTGRPMTRTAGLPNLARLEFLGPIPTDSAIPQGEVYNKSPWAYSALDAIARALSSVPFRVYTGTTDNPKPVADDHPLQKLFDRPSSYQDTIDFWTACTLYVYGYGEVFVWLIADGTMKDGGLELGKIPVQMWPLIPTMFEPANADGSPMTSDAKIPEAWRVTASDGTRTFKLHQVVRVAKFNPLKPLRGLAPLDVAKGPADASYAAMKWQNTSFANGCDPGGWITTAHTSQAKLDEFKKGFEDSHRGPGKAGRWAYVPKDTTITPNPRSPKDMEYIQGLQWWRDEMLAVIGTPKAMLAITDGLNYATHLGQTAVFWNITVIPFMRKIESAFAHGLFSQIENGKYWGAFDTSMVEALQAGFGDKVTIAAGLVNGLGYSTNQANERLQLGMPEVSDALAPGDPVLAAIQGQAPTAADAALQPAQVEALKGIIESVQKGELAPEAAVMLIVVSFPSITEAQAKQMVDAAQSFTPEQKAPPTPDPTSADNPPPIEAQTKGAPLMLVRASVLPIADRVAHVMDYVSRALIPIERRFKGDMARYLGALKAEQLARLEAWMKTNGVSDKEVAALSPSDVDAILFQRERWDRIIQQVATPHLNTAISYGLSSAAKESGSFSLPMADPAIQILFGQSIAKLVDTNATAQDGIRANFAASQAQGETIQELQQRIADGGEFTQARALNIARTETGMGSSGARYIQSIAAGISKHEWVNAGSGDIRESHQLKPIGVGGEVVDLGSLFSNGLRHPHEIGAPASEVCSCRCEALAVS